MSPVKPANTNGGNLKIVLRLPAAKGQLILKCPFGVFKSPKKTTKFLRTLYTTHWRIFYLTSF